MASAVLTSARRGRGERRPRQRQLRPHPLPRHGARGTATRSAPTRSWRCSGRAPSGRWSVCTRIGGLEGLSLGAPAAGDLGEDGGIVAVKVIKNQPAYYHQALVEVSVLKLVSPWRTVQHVCPGCQAAGTTLDQNASGM